MPKDGVSKTEKARAKLKARFEKQRAKVKERKEFNKQIREGKKPKPTSTTSSGGGVATNSNKATFTTGTGDRIVVNSKGEVKTINPRGELTERFKISEQRAGEIIKSPSSISINKLQAEFQKQTTQDIQASRRIRSGEPVFAEVTPKGVDPKVLRKTNKGFVQIGDLELSTQGIKETFKPKGTFPATKPKSDLLTAETQAVVRSATRSREETIPVKTEIKDIPSPSIPSFELKPSVKADTTPRFGFNRETFFGTPGEIFITEAERRIPRGFVQNVVIGSLGVGRGVVSAARQTVTRPGETLLLGTVQFITKPFESVGQISTRIQAGSLSAGEVIGEQLFFTSLPTTTKGVVRGVSKPIQSIRSKLFDFKLESLTPTEPSLFTSEGGFITSSGGLQTQLIPKKVNVGEFIGKAIDTKLGESVIPTGLDPTIQSRLGAFSPELKTSGFVEFESGLFKRVETKTIGTPELNIFKSQEFKKALGESGGVQTTFPKGGSRNFDITIIEIVKGKDTPNIIFGNAKKGSTFVVGKKGSGQLGVTKILERIFEPPTELRVKTRSLTTDNFIKAGGESGLISSPKTFTPVLTISTTRSGSSVKTSTGIVSSEKIVSDSKLIDRFKPLVSKTGTIDITKPISRTSTGIRDIAKPVSGTSSRSGTSSVSITDTGFIPSGKFSGVSITELIKPPKPIPKIKPSIPKVKVTSSKSKSKRFFEDEGFNVLVKRFGKFRLAGTSLSRSAALDLGVSKTKSGLSATFKLVKTGSRARITSGSGAFKKFKSEFRTFKKRKGTKVGLVDTFIQKRKYRLGTKSEVKAIQKSKRNSFISKNNRIGGFI